MNYAAAMHDRNGLPREVLKAMDCMANFVDNPDSFEALAYAEKVTPREMASERKHRKLHKQARINCDAIMAIFLKNHDSAFLTTQAAITYCAMVTGLHTVTVRRNIDRLTACGMLLTEDKQARIIKHWKGHERVIVRKKNGKVAKAMVRKISPRFWRICGLWNQVKKHAKAKLTWVENQFKKFGYTDAAAAQNEMVEIAHENSRGAVINYAKESYGMNKKE